MVLKPALYKRLDKRVPGGVVKVSNVGLELAFQVVEDVTGKITKRKIRSGEEYVVRCPYCEDRSGHLYVSYLYGSYDEDTQEEIRHLVTCVRRNCLANPDNRREFHELVFSGFRHPEAGVSSTEHRASLAGETQAAQLTSTPLPGRVLPIDAIQPEAAAAQYLSRRGYDLGYLATQYRVGYCVESRYPIEGRIFIPIFMDGVMVGWQARVPADLDWKTTNIRKYWNMPGMPRRLVLYNHDQARKYPVVVVCEGVTDVWSIGLPGVALLGKTCSHEQAELLLNGWGKGVIIVLLDGDDPDAKAAAERICDTLQPRISGQIVNLLLPEGLDPGVCPRGPLWQFMRNMAAAEGVTIPEQMVQEMEEADRCSCLKLPAPLIT